MVDSQGIISVPRKKKKKKVLPQKSIFARAYAARAEVISCPNVTASATTNEFRIQRVRFGSSLKTLLTEPQSRLAKSGTSVGDNVGPCKLSESANSSGRSTRNATTPSTP